MKRVFSILVCFVIPVFICCSQSLEKVEGLGLNNMYKVDEGVYRSEQPGDKQFEALEKYGIKESLSLRYWNSDKKHIKNTTIIAHRVRMNAHDINDYDVINALRIIKNRKGPILIHCKHGSDRTGVIVAMYRLVFQDWSKEDALTELKTEDYGFHKIYVNIPRYINNVDVDYIKQQVNYW